ncbi:MAG: hypothetical protein PHT07_13140 [Paludibacter sp.]|nr:hypothetical protein [Paludibacter sp.]
MKSFFRPEKMLIILVMGLTLLASCTNDYLYSKKEPAWLGSSIYDYLKTDGHYTNYVKLIDDLGYAEVLKLTGSKTLFVVNDSSFTEFYKANVWNVKSYTNLTLSQKKMLFNFSMVNNAFLLHTLTNYYDGALHEGAAMRNVTALNALDTISFDIGEKVSTGKYWDNYRTKGIHVMKDDSDHPIVFFTPQFLSKYAFTDEDFSILTGGKTRAANDVFVFNSKVIKQDIVCKNGYIQVLQNVLIPPTNMAQYIQDNSKMEIPTNLRTSIFSKLLDRFSAPYFDATKTVQYHLLHPESTDSIFIKHYFADNGGVTYLPSKTSTGTPEPALNRLPFDPGWNSYHAFTPTTSTALQADMAVMFVPTDDAMNEYLNSGVGAILKKSFGSWENVPDQIVMPFIKEHMRSSMIESVPSRFRKMVDAQNYQLPVTTSDIKASYTAVNGEVFVTNKAYPPVDYISVYSPVLLSTNTQIMNWAINYAPNGYAFYKLYLNSLVNTYSLFIPTDEYLNKYIDPIAYGQDKQGVLKYKFISKTSSVTAYIYAYDKTTGVVGTVVVDSITSTNNNANNPTFLSNRLWNMLDSHIVVGSVDNGDGYYLTKGNDFIKVGGSGTSMTVKGGADIVNTSTPPKVTEVFSQANGKTYFLDKPISATLKSVYQVLSENPEFSTFFELLSGVPSNYVEQLFETQGIDNRVKFFNAYRYTVYVPTNAALKTALAAKIIPSWDEINAMAPNDTLRNIAINKIVKFLKYHFQDNAVFFGQPVNDQFQSSTLKVDNNSTLWGTSKNKYFKLGVVGDANSLKITMDSKSGDPIRTANVLTADPITGKSLYNLIAKDYVFNDVPVKFKNIDGTGTVLGAKFNTSSISTSASAVIHQIDNVLTFE